jgi:anaphase-promoting complex subunit 3
VVLNYGVGAVPENIDEILPPRALPTLPIGSDIGPSGSGPVATGAGFFTPETGGGGPPIRSVKQDLRMQALRLEPSTGSA